MRRTQRKINEIQINVLEAATDSRQWETVLERLYREMDATGVALAEFDFASDRGDIVHYFGFEPYFVRRYKNEYSPRDVWLKPGGWYVPGRVTFGREIIPDEELIHSSFYREWCEPQGFFHRLCGTINQEANRINYLTILRDRTQSAYSNVDRRFIESLLPYFQQALRVNNRLWQYAIVQDALNKLAHGVVAVDRHRRLLFANCVADKVLKAGKGLNVKSQELYASAPIVDKQLQAAIIEAATATPGAKHAGGALLIRRGGGLLPCWLVVTPMTRPLRRVIGQETREALIFVSVPENVNLALDTTLSQYYSLSPTEQRLTILMFKGYRLSEAASELGITVNTARTHMKRIHIKTKTGRLTDLIRLLLTGPVGVGAGENAVPSISNVGAKNEKGLL